ncbi:hypothetical protein [Azospirillum doebereinerae]|nr:hypothetical protein [Azospirillum doebereinerae]
MLAWIVMRGSDTRLNAQIALALIGFAHAIIPVSAPGTVHDDRNEGRET